MKLELVGLAIVSVFLFMAIFAPMIVSFIPHAKSEKPYSPPSKNNLLGTNDIGEDVLVDLIYASRVSLFVGITSAFLSTTIGFLIGVLSGYYRGFLNDALGGLTDLFLVIPLLPLMIVFAAYLESSIWNMILIIAMFWWPSTARVVRAKVMELRESQFVEGLKCLGANDLYIITRHIMPNIGELFFAKFTLSIARAILLEASLSFIGLGDPTHKSWGSMLHYSMKRGSLLNGAWWSFVPPGICISLVAMSFMLLGMGLEERKKKTKPISLS